MTSKRGSLSISTNAIVVLIIAVIMLGLIIGLVTRGFSAVERQFIGQIQENEPEPGNPSSSQPITLSSNSKFASRGEQVGFKVKILNTLDDDLVNVTPKVECLESTIASGDVAFEQDIETNQVAEYLYSFTVSETAAEDTYLCRILAENDTGTLDIEAAEFRLTIE